MDKIIEIDDMLAQHMDQVAGKEFAHSVEALGAYLAELDRSLKEFDDAAQKLVFWSNRIINYKGGRHVHKKGGA